MRDYPVQAPDWCSVLACPDCRGDLAASSDGATCRRCGRKLPREDGILRCLEAEHLERYGRFLREYGTVRADEGWGAGGEADRAAYFRALPDVPAQDPHRGIWRRRATSLRVLLRRVVEPARVRLVRPLLVVDAGAGNGWLAHRLASAGDTVVAVDLSADREDGLGATIWYEPHERIIPVVAEFDRLPLRDDRADLVIFNASLHYSTDYARTLREALRVLRPDGALIVMDSPLYRDPASGMVMVREREETYERRYGFRSNALVSEHFLTRARLEALAADLHLRWELWPTEPRLLPGLRRWRARLRGRREPASMPLVVGRFGR